MRLQTLSIIGIISAIFIPGSASAAVNTTTAESVSVGSELSVGFESWLLLFGIAALLFLLSLWRWEVNEAPEFLGLTAFVFFGFCGIALPYVGRTEYLTETVVVGSEIVQVVTPVLISQTNWLMVAATIFMIFLSLINAWRILMARVQQATPDATIRERRERRRAELLENWRR